MNPPSSQIAGHLNKAPVKIQSLSLFIGFGMWQAACMPFWGFVFFFREWWDLSAFSKTLALTYALPTRLISYLPYLKFSNSWVPYNTTEAHLGLTSSNPPHCNKWEDKPDDFWDLFQQQPSMSLASEKFDPRKLHNQIVAGIWVEQRRWERSCDKLLSSFSKKAYCFSSTEEDKEWPHSYLGLGKSTFKRFGFL